MNSQSTQIVEDTVDNDTNSRDYVGVMGGNYIKGSTLLREGVCQ